jgi:hypothetical protein
MNTCKTCVYWKEESIGIHKFRVCDSNKIQEECGQPKGERLDMLVYSYYEGGYFKSGPDFGCVHHKTVSLSTDK